MEKCILVMDMPSGCVECPLYNYVPSRCFVNGKFQNNISIDFKPKWCPLKTMPQKKKERYGINRQTSTGQWETYGEKTDGVAVGYNACIDEILGGSEE